MTDTKLENIAKLYSDNVREKGACSAAVGWTSPEGHELRSQKLAYLVEREREPFSVNDLGCGYGAFYEYLVEHGHAISHYNGYDISREMIEAAEKQLPADKVSLFNGGDLETEADYSFAGGTFNVRGSVSNDQWQSFVLDTINQMHENSRKGFSFNLLSTHVDWQEPHLFYGNPALFFDHCKSKLGCRVSLLHDYALYEWTIAAYRP